MLGSMTARREKRGPDASLHGWTQSGFPRAWRFRDGSIRRHGWEGALKAAIASVLVVALTACASVSSTSQFYLATTERIYPPKPKDAPIPIMGKAPASPYRVIGKLRFQTDQGWPFLRKSMLYNARSNGADAVILKDTWAFNRWGLVQVPPTVNWMPVPGPYYQDCNGGWAYGGPAWVPWYQPGYVVPTVRTITGIDSEMIVFKR